MNKQKILKRTPTFDEINKLLPSLLDPINDIIYGYMGNPFIITLNIEPYHDKAICIPAISAIDGFSIEWGDDKCQYISSGFADIKYKYSQPGKYIVHIYGEIIKISFEGIRNLIEISQWGNGLRLMDARNSFRDCIDLIITARDQPNLSDARDLSNMFRNCDKIGNINISKWNVRKVTNMSEMFYGCERFNADLSNWNVCNVNNMSKMFWKCLNSDLKNWNVSKVTNMSEMFVHCTSFKSDLSKWDVSKVTDMNHMFANCGLFNSDLSKWDVSNVINMEYMFSGCKKFNADLSNWDVRDVIHLYGILAGCNAFNLNRLKFNNKSHKIYIFGTSGVN